VPRTAQFEHDFLTEACRGAGLVSVGLTEMAQERLAEGERLYGDKSLGLTLEQLAGQVEEEIVDVACWSAIMAQADAMEDLDDDKRMGVVALLESLTGIAAQQAFLVREVRKTLKR
jgi:hypothetical protein